jgi:hypothetical protein
VTSRPLAAVLLAGLLALLPACSSSDGGTSRSSAPSSTSSAAAQPGAALADDLRQGVADIHTAKVGVVATLLGQGIVGRGPAIFEDGELTEIDLRAVIKGVGGLRVIAKGDKVYAQVPAALNQSGKPWLLVQADSTNVVASQLGSALDGIRGAASLNNLVAMVEAATSVQDKGVQNLRGTPAHRYTMLVDATKLPQDFPARDDLVGPLKDKPIDLWLDAQDRPVQIQRTVIIQGAETPVTITAGAFNRPVTITAPPPSQVSSS